MIRSTKDDVICPFVKPLHVTGKRTAAIFMSFGDVFSNETKVVKLAILYSRIINNDAVQTSSSAW